MNFQMSWTWSPSFIKIWDDLMPKLTCLSYGPNGGFHVLNWSFDKKKPQIWCMNAQVEIHMLNHQEKCFDPKWSYFHEFLMISEMQAIVGLPISWKVLWRKVLNLMACVLSWSENHKVNGKWSFQNMKMFSTWQFLFENEKLL